MLRHGQMVVLLLIAGATGLAAQQTRATVAPTLILPIPGGVTISGQAPQIAVTWQPVSMAIDYVVLRTADPTQPGTPVLPGPEATPGFLDQTGAGGTVYFYTVVARFSGGQSTTSAQVRFDPPAVILKSPRPVSRRLTGAAAPPADDTPTITSVSDTVVPSGRGTTMIIRGRNLWDVTGIYFGTGALGSWSNPRIEPRWVSPAMDEVQFQSPSRCVARGTLMLEQEGYPGEDPKNITYVTQSGPVASQIRMYCAGAPVVAGVQGPIRVGGAMVIQGSNLSWVTSVTSVGALQFRVLNDNQLSVTVPQYAPGQFPLGTATIQPTLVSRLGSVTMSPMQFPLPPFVSSAAGAPLTPGQITPVEEGGTLFISGYALTTPGFSSVTIDGRVASVLSSSSQSLSLTVPAGTAAGTLNISTIGGSANGSFPLMVGPSAISGVSPANAPVGGRVMVSGQNIFRARGVCFSPAAGSRPALQPITVGQVAPPWQQWTNTTVTVDVPANSGSGPLGLYLPSQPNGATDVCQMGKTPLQVP